jgi:hypothetical protein
MYAFQGRSIFDRQPKYLTFCDENIKIYNYYNVDDSKNVDILEGCIDSFFIENAIATSGLTGIENSDLFEIIKKKFRLRTWVFDNPYNDKAGLIKIEQFADAGERVFIWPRKLKNFKDVNEIIEKSDVTKLQLTKYISDNSYQGLSASVNIKLLKSKLK